MIKKYNEFINEGLMQHLTGPSKEEIWDSIKNLKDKPWNMLEKTCKSGLVEHLDEVIHIYSESIIKNDSYMGGKTLYGITLDYGIEFNQTEIVEYALKKETPIEQEHFNIATNNNNPDIIKLLIKYDKNQHRNIDGLLKTASISGYEEITKFYLSEGANPNEYKTLIYVVKLTNNLNIIKILVENGADIHAEKDEALRFASTYGKIKIVKYLLSKGADIHAEEDTALIWAAEDNHPDVVELLLKNGADIHAQNDMAMKMAVKRKRTKVIEVLNKYLEK